MAKKTCVWGSWGKAPPCTNSSLGGGLWLASRPGSLIPTKLPNVFTRWEATWPTEPAMERKISCPCLDSNCGHWTPCRQFTERAIPNPVFTAEYLKTPWRSSGVASWSNYALKTFRSRSCVWPKAQINDDLLCSGFPPSNHFWILWWSCTERITAVVGFMLQTGRLWVRVSIG
jgi:hypothetical protein